MSQEEFERRVLALTQSLYRVCYSLLRREQDREDAVQSCILLAWERRRQLRDPEKFRPWIMRILVNCCRSQLRRTQRELPLAQPPEAPGPEGDSLSLLLAPLPEQYRAALKLRYQEGMSVRDMAYVLRLSEAAVKSRLARARAALRETLKEDFE